MKSKGARFLTKGIILLIMAFAGLFLGACHTATPTNATNTASKSIYETEARRELKASLKHHADVQWIESLKQLPASIRERLASVADKGQGFSAGCTPTEGERMERFLVATKQGQVYTVALEYGGAVYNWTAIAYTLNHEGKIVSFARVEDLQKWTPPLIPPSGFRPESD